MSHSHEHAHSHSDDCHHGNDASDKTLGRAIKVFLLLGTLQLLVAVLGGRIALAVDGAHNMAEAPILGLNRWARRKEGQKLSRLMTCYILPLAPALSALAAIAAACLFFLIESSHETASVGIWLAFVLAGSSFAVNWHYASKLHSHAHDDSNAVAAKFHLFGDMAASGLATLAYLLIGLSKSNFWLDPIAAILGVVIITVVHIKPIKNSLVEFKRHHGVHDNCVNSPSHCH